MSFPISPKVTLVGAGPGDPELITLKGLKAIRSADVVMYDALVNPLLLEEAPEKALRLYVGKRNHRHAYSQEEINVELVRKAFAHGHVVRLKGGDPFVFGRGMEELAHVQAFGINTEVIPGISSAIGVPALAGISVTQRGVSESFWVITGTTRNNTVSAEVWEAAKTHATVVILMGLSKLKEIAAIFSSEGKQDTAVALIQDGSLPGQKMLRATIGTIAGEALREGIQAPAVIVIGEVVRRTQELASVFQQLNTAGN